MSFREKSSWVVFLALLLVYGGYYLKSGFSPPLLGAEGEKAVFAVSQFGLVIGLVVIMIIGHIVAAISSPKTADDPEDEREKLISLRSDSWGGHVTGFGVLLAISTVYFTDATAISVAYWALLALVAGELVSHGARILAYRGVVNA
ncbi:MAG: hypothetical protein CME88_05790 [Hirschia sp.]|nr:hypothetical protein [Hirschia sp.]MBF17876.1 hypothetical protein [Hirschia sp.]